MARDKSSIRELFLSHMEHNFLFEADKCREG